MTNEYPHWRKSDIPHSRPQWRNLGSVLDVEQRLNMKRSSKTSERTGGYHTHSRTVRGLLNAFERCDVIETADGDVRRMLWRIAERNIVMSCCC